MGRNRLGALFQAADFDLQVDERVEPGDNRVTFEAKGTWKIVPRKTTGREEEEGAVDGLGWDDAGVRRAEAVMVGRGRDRWGQPRSSSDRESPEIPETLGRSRTIPGWVWVTGAAAVIVVVVLVFLLVGL